MTLTSIKKEVFFQKTPLWKQKKKEQDKLWLWM